MRISILTIGNELLRGSTVNTNAAFLGEQLRSLGQEAQACLTVPDTPEAIRAALDWLLPQSDLLISSGGLGSTGDDLSRDTVAAYLGLPLKTDPDAEHAILDYLSRHNLHACDREKVMRQALAPESSRIFPNANGSAPGLWIPVPEQHKFICMLPGPPGELRPMTIDHLLPEIEKLLPEKRTYLRILRLAHASELWVEEQTGKLLADAPDITVAYCAEFDHVRLFLSGPDPEKLDALTKQAEKLFHPHLLRSDCSSMPEEALLILRERGLRLSVAESCTGGMIAASITDLAGSSEVFDGGIVSYSNRIKQEQLGVDETLLKQYGAVSEACVKAMAEGVCERFKTDAGIAVSGIAGPGGGTPDKPVGLVFMAARLNGTTRVKRYVFHGNRDTIRRQAVSAAWAELRGLLLGLKE